MKDASVYLLTAACYEHCSHLRTPERRRMALDLLLEQCAQRGVDVHAWAVLTNHYHVLAGVTDFGALGEVFHRVHGRTAHDWNRQDAEPGRKVWYRYSDRAMRSERHYYTTLNYVHYNAVKHGLVSSPYDWPFTSVHWYLEHKGREWLRDLWQRYPIRDYGKQWDDI
jgi:putative transposase